MRAAPVAAIVAVLSVSVVPAASASPDEIAAALAGRAARRCRQQRRAPRLGPREPPYLRLAPAAYADGVGTTVAGPPARYVSNRDLQRRRPERLLRERRDAVGLRVGPVPRPHVRAAPGDRRRERADRVRSHRPARGATSTTSGRSTSPAPRPRPAPAPPASRASRSTRSRATSTRSAVYSDDAARLAWLRDGARLKLDAAGNLPRRGSDPTAPAMALQGRLTGNAAKAMVAGDVRANENLALTATHTLFAREHNRIVDALPATLPRS